MLLVSRPVRTQDDNVKAGVAWMLLTTLFFVSLDAVAKHLVSSYPVIQVVWGRFLFHLILAALILGPRFGFFARSANLPLQIMRSILLLATTVLFFFGVRLLPLADASAIMFTTPFCYRSWPSHFWVKRSARTAGPPSSSHFWGPSSWCGPAPA